MKKTIFAFCIILTFFYDAVAQVQSPTEFLPTYGKQISHYHQVENYFKHLTDKSTFIKQQKYGATPEHRDLNVFFISSPENLANLEQIRNNNLAAIGLSNTKNQMIGDKLIVWLSFNVHGNEFSGTESAMTVAYELINPSNSETKKWLENTIVILDPCINPDGYSRYGNWLREISGKKNHPELSDREHMEEWPGGRYNHYLFDLNRDWAWQTQPESKQRMALYNQWMPQVHTDVHEQGFDSPYFFPPSAEPIHEYIEKYQRDFHAVLGENISKKFDSQNWLYNTSERFDLFYPSYGDTYPAYNGAVGMTLEQGGIGAGREVLLGNGSTLTIKDRFTHHATAVLTVVESASAQADVLLKGFRGFMNNSRKTGKGDYKMYVMKNNPKLVQMAELLKKNNIEFSYADANLKASGFNYSSKTEKGFTIEPNDLIVKIDQPKAVLTQVLFEPNQKLNDSLSYDITAWALPLAYGVEGYALKNSLAFKTKAAIEIKEKVIPQTVYAFHIPWNNRISAQVLSLLHQNNIKVRSAVKQAVFGEIIIEPGGLLVTKADNPKIVDFENKISELVKAKSDYNYIKSGFSSNARDIGGENFILLKAPKILLLSGKGISSTEFGAAWFYLQETVDYPVSVVEMNNIKRVNLFNYNTLILADGDYDFSEEQQNKIGEWIKNGGKVVAMNGALSLFDGKEGYALSPFATDDDKIKSEKEDDEQELKERILDFQQTERREISKSIPGAIIENQLNTTHPLSFGLGDKYYSLKTNDNYFALLKKAINVAFISKDYKSYGFIGSEIKKKLNNTVSFAVDYKGNGCVIYMVDNPLFRGFWENGNLLFSNALFLVN
ncbi:Zinc carboxypeptidase [Flavobacterium micromati]|uniref:Zinc carboxypeptidase n=1 Tax=Flavobacterium micromati TaxID=229205 RepID=A0A1M5HKH6_9FLAO|nr:M14 family zinc carboxypeptidase [Flavobacterium micromati]SHG16437.1 Zinc carboxypeptidase [Flavobacterium micromati]